MSKRITIDELQTYLWDSAVLLRSSIDAGAYKQYIFPLLFFLKESAMFMTKSVKKILEQFGDEEALEFEENQVSAQRCLE